MALGKCQKTFCTPLHSLPLSLTISPLLTLLQVRWLSAVEHARHTPTSGPLHVLFSAWKPLSSELYASPTFFKCVLSPPSQGRPP